MARSAVENEGRVGRGLSLGQGGGEQAEEGKRREGSKRERIPKGEDMKWTARAISHLHWTGTFSTYPGDALGTK